MAKCPQCNYIKDSEFPLNRMEAQEVKEVIEMTLLDFPDAEELTEIYEDLINWLSREPDTSLGPRKTTIASPGPQDPQRGGGQTRFEGDYHYCLGCGLRWNDDGTRNRIFDRLEGEQ